MTEPDARHVVTEQYGRSTARLDARIALHRDFSVTPVPWSTFVFDQLALREDETVLELGAGTGALWQHTLPRLPPGTRLVLSDISPPMCRALAQLSGPRISVLQSDAAAVPVKGGSVDVVLAAHMLYHVSQPDTALAEMARVLRPGGRAYAATNGRDHMKQLAQLMRRVEVSYGGAQLQLPFVLEDAPARMRAHFREVEVVRFDDGLAVTDPSALADYVATVVPLTDGQRAAVMREVAAVIRSEGAFHVTKDVGLLRASR